MSHGDVYLQTTGAKETEPAPSPSRWRQRHQITVAPCRGLFVTGFISFEDSRLSECAEALETHNDVWQRMKSRERTAEQPLSVAAIS